MINTMDLPKNHNQLAEVLGLAITRAILSVDAPENMAREYFAVIINREMAFICDHCGVVDGPYRASEARAIIAEYNEYYANLAG